MKFSKKLIIFAIVLIVSLFTLTNLTLAANNEEYELGVMLKQDETNDKKVHIMLGMTDLDSVASFQLGLDINLDEKVNAKFAFNSDLSNSKYQDSTIKDLSSSDNKNLKRLNIYYVGTKELNPVDSNKIEIGTITFEGTISENTPVTIEPVKDFSTVASVSHKYTQIDFNSLDTVINKKANDDNNNDNNNNNNNGNNNNNNGNQNDKDNGNSNNGESSNGSSSNGNSGDSSNNDSESSSESSDSTKNTSDKKDGNKFNEFIELIKTGANKSVTWAICTIVVLIIAALIIIKLKKKQKKNIK